MYIHCMSGRCAIGCSSDFNLHLWHDNSPNCWLRAQFWMDANHFPAFERAWRCAMNAAHISRIPVSELKILLKFGVKGKRVTRAHWYLPWALMFLMKSPTCSCSALLRGLEWMIHQSTSLSCLGRSLYIIHWLFWQSAVKRPYVKLSNFSMKIYVVVNAFGERQQHNEVSFTSTQREKYTIVTLLVGVLSIYLLALEL